jgi:hypothetical protein
VLPRGLQFQSSSHGPVWNANRRTRHRTRNVGPFRLEPFFHHYRNYRCLITHNDSIRTSDSIILYPTPLVLPGASCFDKLLSLTVDLANTAFNAALPNDPDLQQQYRDCLQQLKTFFITEDFTVTASSPTPVTCSSRHKPSSDTGLDLIGHSFCDKTLGD